jgi:hypothetical protein
MGWVPSGFTRWRMRTSYTERAPEGGPTVLGEKHDPQQVVPVQDFLADFGVTPA